MRFRYSLMKLKGSLMKLKGSLMKLKGSLMKLKGSLMKLKYSIEHPNASKYPKMIDSHWQSSVLPLYETLRERRSKLRGGV
ncbi:MAG: hypothetical protein V7K47_27935 [Nostoc sp.]